MGVEIQLESEYKYRCICTKKKINVVDSSTTAGAAGSVSLSASSAAATMIGSATSNKVSLFYQFQLACIHILYPNFFPLQIGKRHICRFLRLRLSRELVVCCVDCLGDSHRKCPITGQVPHSPLPFEDETAEVVSEALLFGDPSQDAGDEVQFSVELTRLDRLNDTLSLSISGV